MSIVDNVRSKAEEYGLEIFNDYPIEGKEYIFFIEDMMLFVNEEEKTIGVSFQASTRPERVGNMILILNEINEELDIVESFIFDKNNRYLSGEKAFELIERTKQSETIQSFLKDQTLREILLKSKCHEC
jgi:hypothetical protein